MPEVFSAKEFNQFDRVGGGKGKFHHLFIAALVKVGKEKAGVIIGESHKNGEEVVSLTLNGVEVPVLAVCEEWDKQYEQMLGEAAAELLGTKLRGVLDKLDELVTITEREGRKAIEAALGIELRRDE